MNMPTIRLQVLQIVIKQHFENGSFRTKLEKSLSLFFLAHLSSLFADYCLNSFPGLLTCFKGFMFGKKHLLSNYSFLQVFKNLLISELGLIIINFMIIIEHLMRIISFSHFGLY
jgi:hypothetical protein